MATYRRIMQSMQQWKDKWLVAAFSGVFGLVVSLFGVRSIFDGRFALVGSGRWPGGGGTQESLANVTGPWALVLSVVATILGLGFLGFSVWLVLKGK